MKIVVIFPTQTEAQFFAHPEVDVEICGVGLTSAAYNTTKIIARHQPDWLIMAGIAGVYPHSSYKVGDVVLVASEREADLGFFTADGFTHLSDLELDMDFTATHQLDCPYVSQVPVISQLAFIPVVHSNSMNVAMAPFVNIAQIDIENMEGAAFFHVCRAEQQKFLQIRAISNPVKIGGDDWDMVGSIQALTKGLHQLIEQLLMTQAEEKS